MERERDFRRAAQRFTQPMQLHMTAVAKTFVTRRRPPLENRAISAPIACGNATRIDSTMVHLPACARAAHGREKEGRRGGEEGRGGRGAGAGEFSELRLRRSLTRAAPGKGREEEEGWGRRKCVGAAVRTFDGDCSRKLARAGPCVCGSVCDHVARARKCAVSCEKTTDKYLIRVFYCHGRH